VVRHRDPHKPLRGF